MIFQRCKKRLLIPCLDKAVKVPFNFPGDAFIALLAADALLSGSETGRSGDNNCFFKEIRVSEQQGQCNPASHGIADKQAGRERCLTQFRCKRIDCFREKEVGVAVCCYAALSMAGQVDQNAAVLFFKLPGNRKPVVARAQKAVQEDDAG